MTRRRAFWLGAVGAAASCVWYELWVVPRERRAAELRAFMVGEVARWRRTMRDIIGGDR